MILVPKIILDETDIIGRNSSRLSNRHSRKNDQIGYYAVLEKLGAHLHKMDIMG